MSDWLNNPTDIKYCRQCGTPMRITAAFCPGCGAKQPETTPQPAPVSAVVPEAVSAPETPVTEEPIASEMPVTEEVAVPEVEAVTEMPEGVPVEMPVEVPAEEPQWVAPEEKAAPEPPVPPVPPVFTPSAPEQQPPHRKKSGTLVALLAVACAVLVLGMAVLTAWVLVDRSNLPAGESSDETGSATSSEVSGEESSKPSEESSENSYYDASAPELIISDSTVEDGGLSTSQIVKNNLNNTVVLTMYDYQTVNSFLGSSSNKLAEIGSASGVIMTADGYIITNAHCVADEKTGEKYARVDVTLYSGETYTANIIGYDQTTDLAVIKIDASGLQVAEFGDSSKLGLGDRVVVLGNGAGLGWSCTQGIVSGIGRDVYEDTGYAIRCIQTDAIINPGNSGGPLFNNVGQVIGINSAKIVAEGYEGIGFSIPINEAKTVIDDLLKYGYVKGRVAIGITGADTNTEGYEGFMIDSIAADSSLSGTDAKRGDIITAVDGETVAGYSDLRRIMATHKAGDTVTLTLRRLEFDRSGRYIKSDTTLTVTCTLQESTG